MPVSFVSVARGGLLAVSLLMTGCSAAEVPSLTDAQLTAACLDSEPINHPDAKGHPVERIVARSGDNQVRVYVSEADHWISACRSDRTDVVQVSGSTTENTDPADPFSLFEAEDSVLKSRLLLGRLPAGATTVQAVLESGEQLTAYQGGDVFLIWAPERAVSRARLTASAPDGAIIATITAPAAEM